MQALLWAGFVLALAFGAVAQRTQFCTMGAIADIRTMGDWSRMRQWVLAMGVAMLAFSALVAFAGVQASHTIYASPRWLWLSHAVGGTLFGIGMVLASGCGSRTLVRIGGGNLKSLVVFLVLGLAAFATLRGLSAVWRVETVDRVAVELPAPQDLPSLLGAAFGWPVPRLAWLVGGALAFVLIGWALARPEGRRADVLAGGLGLGAVIAALWALSGLWGRIDEHPETLELAFLGTRSGRMEALSFVAPLADTLDWLLFYSDKSKRLTLGVVCVVGVVLGSALQALASRRFRWEGFAGVRDTVHHLVGAALMGVGGVAALGCTVGQGISGLSTLALGSFVTLAGIVGGALLALRYQVWQVERSA